MAELIIRDEELARRLLDLARREKRSVEDVLAALLAEHVPVTDEKAEPGSFALLAQSAQDANLRSEATDTSERSREILATEYADYLKRRLNDQDPD